ncbi:hypothetical protein SABIM44S_00569 [Streptomyces abikoensis]
MSIRTRCRVCGWSRAYRNQYAGRRATRTHTCPPLPAKGLPR